MKRVAFIAFTIVTFLYIFLGAVVFHFIEGKSEREGKKTFILQHRQFLESHTGMSPEALRDYIIHVMEAHASGVNVIAIATNSINNTNNSTNDSTPTGGDSDDDDDDHDDLYGTNWDLVSAFLFCLTVVSTVGYGNIAPKTEGGQLFCIMFALIGIPLFATSLVGVGERLQIPLKRIKKCRAWCKSDPKKDEQLKTAVFLTSGICILVFIPSYVLSQTEDWSFTESLYFCVITLTTIGFGDYLPEATHVHLFYIYRIIICVWILLGLSWIALILSELASIMQEKIIEATKRTSSKIIDFEDMVKKKAKDAREKIVQKASMHWHKCSHDMSPKDPDGRGDGEDPDVYTIISPADREIGDKGMPGSYRLLDNPAMAEDKMSDDLVDDQNIRRDVTF